MKVTIEADGSLTLSVPRLTWASETEFVDTASGPVAVGREIFILSPVTPRVDEPRQGVTLKITELDPTAFFQRFGELWAELENGAVVSNLEPLRGLNDLNDGAAVASHD